MRATTAKRFVFASGVASKVFADIATGGSAKINNSSIQLRKTFLFFVNSGFEIGILNRYEICVPKICSFI